MVFNKFFWGNLNSAGLQIREPQNTLTQTIYFVTTPFWQGPNVKLIESELPSGSATVTLPLYWPTCGQLISEIGPAIEPLQLDTEPENVSSFTGLSGSFTVTEIVTLLGVNCIHPVSCVHDTRLIEGRLPEGGSPDMGLSSSLEHLASTTKMPRVATNIALIRNCIFPLI